MKIAAIINYCTNDYKFIKKTIDHVIPIVSQILVPVCDHYFTGEPENRELLQKSYDENPNAQFIEYEWDDQHNTRYWSNMSRAVAKSQLNDDIDWILLMDSDEVIETELFLDWMKEEKFNLLSYKFAAYYYFREPIYQSTVLEDCIVLCRRSIFNPDVYNMQDERGQYGEAINIPKRDHILHKSGVPMVHHYSWVRTKEEMIKKVSTWWHREDRNWVTAVEEEFSRPFNGKDFVHDWLYKTVENKFNI